MDLQKARKILGKDASNQTDEQIQEYINTASLLADIAIGTILKMTPAQRKKYRKNANSK